MIKTILLGSMLSFFAISASAAPFGAACIVHESMVERLSSEYQEIKIGYGDLHDEVFSELYVSDLGTWSFIIVLPNGMACMIASGNDWKYLSESQN